MAAPRPSRTRVFGSDDAALDREETSSIRRFTDRLSFRPPSFLQRRSSATTGTGVDGEEQREYRVEDAKAPIPTTSMEPDSTPLPKLSMIVLSIAMLAEFLSASVAGPFMLFMVKGFGTLQDDAEVALWTGLLVSTFFLTQFLTSLLWATIASKHGRRLVLLVSLLGSSVTCALFGTSSSLNQALCIRLLQGVFGGAIGVARGAIGTVTDQSNEGRAYAILGFCWGFGGVAGAIVGGTFERPAEKWPEVFGSISLFITYPYLLPTLMASSVTLTGAVLACFLDADGGPREGSIRLPEKDSEQGYSTIHEEDEESVISAPPFDQEDAEDARVQGSFTRNLGKKISGYFASPTKAGPSTVPLESPTGALAAPAERTRPMSISIQGGGGGSAYYGGPGTSYRNRLASNATQRSFGRRRYSNASSMRRRGGAGGESYRESGNFAQRLLMANGDAVTSMADLWVSAAMNVDNTTNDEDPFYDSDEEDAADETDTSLLDSEIRGRRGSASSATPSGKRMRPSLSPAPRDSFSTPTAQRTGLNYGSVRRPSGPAFSQRKTSFQTPLAESTPRPHMQRRTSSGTGPSQPSIFAHPGVKTPPAVLDAQQLLLRPSSPSMGGEDEGLDTIMESRRASTIGGSPTPADLPLPEAPSSMMSQLPVIVIVQYGLLALHSTTHDQVFMSYLVTDYEGGGLNLNAGHFAQLIALMCFCQIMYQFYLYPNIGPPRGKFSHLAMFRLGMLLLIPAYVSVCLYRLPFASSSEDGNAMLMLVLSLSTAVRFCGNTFAYTAVSILLNYMTPPDAVGFANGIAQTIVSLGRCLGPILGGWLWSVSTEDNPGGYPLGFIACAAFCGLAFLHSFWIR